MKNAPILIVLAVGAMLGWFSPDAPGSAGTFSAEGGDEAAAVPAPAEQDAAELQQWYAGNVVLPRAPDGHFYADITVGSATRSMLVDTGASMIALTADDAAAMGVRWDQADVRPVGSGASGAVYGVYVTLDKVKLGRLEASHVEAIVVPKGLDISLLGQSFLSSINNVEMDQDKMVLGG